MAKKSKSKPITSLSHKGQLAAQVAPHVEICGIRILKMSAQDKHTLATKGGIRIEIQASAVTVLRNNMLTVTANFELEGISEKSDKGEVVLAIQATYEVKYTLAKGEVFSQTHLSAFGENNGIFNIWPYWREYVQNMTTRMALPALTLPVRRLILPKGELRLKKKS